MCFAHLSLGIRGCACLFVFIFVREPSLKCYIRFSLISKSKIRLIKSPSLRLYLSVFSPLITSETLCRFHEIWYRGNANQGDLDAIIFNPIRLHGGLNLLGEPC
jgi:hypothetical protein